MAARKVKDNDNTYIAIDDILVQPKNNVRLDTGEKPLTKIEEESLPKDHPRRIRRADYEELKASIGSQGLLQNLVVMPNPDYVENSTVKPYILVDGYRRFAIVRELREEGRWPTTLEDDRAGIGAVVMAAPDKGITPKAQAIMAALGSTERADLQWWEVAEAAFKAIEEEKVSSGALATAAGFSKSHMSNLVNIRRNLRPKYWEEIKENAKRGTTTVAMPDGTQKSLILFAVELKGLSPAEQDERWKATFEPARAAEGADEGESGASDAPARPAYQFPPSTAAKKLAALAGATKDAYLTGVYDMLAYILGKGPAPEDMPKIEEPERRKRGPKSKAEKEAQAAAEAEAAN